MKLRRPFAALAALALAAVVAGCGKSGSGSVAPTIPLGTVDDLVRLVQQSFVSGAVAPTSLDPNVGVLSYTLDVDGRRGATAFFIEQTATSQTLIDAGNVSVAPVAGGSLGLTAHVLNVLGSINTVYTTFISRPGGIELPFDGTTQHTFTVTGSPLVEAFTDSVKSVSRPVLTAPLAAAVVDSLDSLTVRWSDVPSDSTVYVLALLRSTVDTTSTALSELRRDTGETSIPQEELVRLPSGPARLSVARFRIHARFVGARKAALVCEAVTLRSVTMQ